MTHLHRGDNAAVVETTVVAVAMDGIAMVTAILHDDRSVRAERLEEVGGEGELPRPVKRGRRLQRFLEVRRRVCAGHVSEKVGHVGRSARRQAGSELVPKDPRVVRETEDAGAAAVLSEGRAAEGEERGGGVAGPIRRGEPEEGTLQGKEGGGRRGGGGGGGGGERGGRAVLMTIIRVMVGDADARYSSG